MPSPKAVLTGLRQKRPFLDHLIRTVQRYQADNGERMAAGVTFYWFLSLFPILLLAVSLLGYVYGDESTAKVQDALGGILPANAVETIGTTLEEAKGPAGVIGIVGLLFSGLGWIDALREAIRSMWHQNVLAGNFVVKKLVDIVVLVGLFATIAASVAVTGVTTAATGWVLELVGIEESAPARFFTAVLAYGLALLADTLLFLYLFARLSRVKSPIRRIIKGAIFGAVGFEILKILGGFYVARTTTKGAATYGTFAVVVGLLLFLNLVSRLLLLTAAFVVTAPYDSDIAPSGTASKDMARKAGIPEEFVDDDPDDPPNLQEEGAPAPLQAAVLGRTPPQHEPQGRRSTGASGKSDAKEAPAAEGGVDQTRSDARGGVVDPYPQEGDRRPARVASGPSLPSEEAVVRAARVTAAAGGVVLVGLGVQGLRTLGRLARH
jgi:membrane protein